MINSIITHQSLANQCLKTGKSGSLFKRLYEVVRIACNYTVKKCKKEMSKDSNAVMMAPLIEEEYYPEPSFDLYSNPITPFKISLIPVE